MKRTVIITGGNRGIGEAITRAFWDNGDHVLVGSRSEPVFLSNLHERIKHLLIDVRNESDHEKLAQTATDWTGKLDVYVNCAGFSDWRPMEEVDEDFWDTMMDTNLKGTFWGCKTASRHMPEGGCIINISSLAGKRGSANNSVYCASKFGVNGITQALAKELGPRGIRVNAVCPVYVQTEGLLTALKNPRSPSGGNVETYLKEFAQRDSSLKRLPSADEVARLCLFIASPSASAITGQCINIDCGVLPQ